jgi:hypothetical protein
MENITLICSNCSAWGNESALSYYYLLLIRRQNDGHGSDLFPVIVEYFHKTKTVVLIPIPFSLPVRQTTLDVTLNEWRFFWTSFGIGDLTKNDDALRITSLLHAIRHYRSPNEVYYHRIENSVSKPWRVNASCGRVSEDRSTRSQKMWHGVGIWPEEREGITTFCVVLAKLHTEAESHYGQKLSNCFGLHCNGTAMWSGSQDRLRISDSNSSSMCVPSTPS